MRGSNIRPRCLYNNNKRPTWIKGGIWLKHSFADLFLKPDAFFQDLVTKKENLARPAIIILAAGIAAGTYACQVGGLTATMMAGIMPGMETIIVLSAFFGALFFTFIFWAVWSAVIFALSSVFKGNGSFKRTMECVGYGYLPQVVGILITSIVAYSYIPQVKVPALSTAAIQDPRLIQEATGVLMHDPSMMALAQITSVVSIVFLVLSANIWIFGLKHARMLSLRDATICVSVPVVSYIIYILYMMTVM